MPISNERKREIHAKYRLNNPDKIAERHKTYSKTERGYRMRVLNRWKHRGIIGDLDALYDIYIDTLICDNCQVWFNNKCKKTIKCHDHCHNCGLSKGIVCHVCNIHNKVECQACN